MIRKGGDKPAAHPADEEETLALGGLMAETLPPGEPRPKILLCGPLGAGKTTLVRGFVQSLPGGAEARVSSPSFNVVNVYPTEPECAHIDLYRLEGGRVDEDVLEHLGSEETLAVVEWGERLRGDALPESRLRLDWTGMEPVRTITFTAVGGRAEHYLKTLIEAAGR